MDSASAATAASHSKFETDTTGGIVKAEGLDDGRTHSQVAIAKLRLTLPPGEYTAPRAPYSWSGE
jgi:hypothetical protein